MKSIRSQVTGVIILVAMFVCAWFAQWDTNVEVYHTSQVTTVKLHHAFIEGGKCMTGRRLGELWFCQDDRYEHFHFNVVVSRNVFGHESRTYAGAVDLMKILE